MTIQVENVCLKDGDRDILKNVNWEISSDDTWLLTGDHGSGKSALISIITGMLKPTSGRVRLLGDYKYDRVNAGVVFQEDRLIENLTAAENVAVIRPETSPAVAAEELETFLDKESINIPVSALDPVKRRITAIVRACSVPSDIILLDEPFAGMDDSTRKKAFSYIKEVAGHKGIVISAADPEGLPPLRTFRLT